MRELHGVALGGPPGSEVGEELERLRPLPGCREYTDRGVELCVHGIVDQLTEHPIELAPRLAPLVRFAPSGGQLGAALLLIGAGLGATLLIGRLGGTETSD